MPVEISKEEWAMWRENEVTKRVFGMIAERREEAIEHLAFGTATNTLKQNITIGAINAYTHILNMRFEGDE